MHEISRFPGEPGSRPTVPGVIKQDTGICYRRPPVFSTVRPKHCACCLLRLTGIYRWRAFLSPNRCLALAPAGSDRWRLWSIFRAEKTLAEALDNALQNSPASQLADKLVEIAHFLLQAARTFAQYDTLLPASLETVGYIDGQPVYIGFLPMATTRTAKASSEIEPFIRQHFSTPVKQTLNRQGINVPHVLRGLQRFKNSGSTDAIIAETFAALFIGQ